MSDDERVLVQLESLRIRNTLDLVMNAVFAVVFFVTGVSTITGLSPAPPSIENSLETVAYTSWSMLLIVGSPLVLVGRIRNLLGVEAAGALGVGLAFLTYTIAVIGNRFPSGVIAAAIFFAIAAAYLYRGYLLNRLLRRMRHAEK